MATKKHYVAIAKIFADEIKLTTRMDDTYAVLASVAGQLATVLKEENPRFDWYKFLEACGVE